MLKHVIGVLNICFRSRVTKINLCQLFLFSLIQLIDQQKSVIKMYILSVDLGRPGDRPVTFVAVLHGHGNILLGHPNPEAEGVVLH